MSLPRESCTALCSTAVDPPGCCTSAAAAAAGSGTWAEIARSTLVAASTAHRRAIWSRSGSSTCAPASAAPPPDAVLALAPIAAP